MTVATPIKIQDVKLDSGAHETPYDGMCVMEAVAYFAGEPWSDHPDCVCPVIGAFLRRWNDDLGDDARQILKPYITRVVGTRSTKDVESRRAWMATDFMVRVHTSAWLDLGGMSEQATALRSLPPLTPDSVQSAITAINTARSKAAAAWAAAGAAARDAAGAAAWAAARAAAGAAAWDAARAAAGAAAGAKLQPTVVSLTESALDLLNRMIDEGRDA